MNERTRWSAVGPPSTASRGREHQGGLGAQLPPIVLQRVRRVHDVLAVVLERVLPVRLEPDGGGLQSAW